MYENLPEIEIEIILSDSREINMNYFNGYHSSEKEKSKSGIRFRYSFDENFKEMFQAMNFDGKPENIFIPTDYYSPDWQTFGGHKYNRRKSPLRNLMIDNSERKNNLFDSYTKQVFINNVPVVERSGLSHSLKENLSQFLSKNKELLKIGSHTFGIDERKSYIEQLLDLKSEGISIQNMGKGRENLIKTEIALEETSDLILLEEPENHLSFINTRKLIEDIRSKHEGIQIILTTHSPLIVSRMNLSNTIWINENKSYSLSQIPKETAEYFEKTDNMGILHFILSKKVCIVEGNSEYILLPYLVKNTLSFSLDKAGVEVLSGAGITYKHYVEVSKVIKNKLLVITDNDNSQETIDNINSDNAKYKKKNLPILIKCDQNIENFTFEVCLYEKNKDTLKGISDCKPRTHAEYRGSPMTKGLAFMLKNKTESALKITKDYESVLLPEYIKEGLEWLIQS